MISFLSIYHFSYNYNSLSKVIYILYMFPYALNLEARVLPLDKQLFTIQLKL